MHRHRSNTVRDYASERRARAVRRAARAEEAARRERAIDAALRRDGRAVFAARDASLESVLGRAPRLGDSSYLAAVRRLLAQAHVRPLETWAPRGKGRGALFRSLADHLLAEYVMPAIVWSAFFDDHAERLVPIVVRIARGGSFADAIREVDFPIALTRRMCHDVLVDRHGDGIFRAIRRAQVLAAGGDNRLADRWLGAHQAHSLGSRAQEEFLVSVVAWLVKNAIDARDLGPLLDFILHRRDADATFSMKGRSAAAMLRGVHEWHRELAVVKAVHRFVFASSGFVSATYDLSDRAHGISRKRIWRVTEILTGKTLAEEGRRMNHCVYSYAARIERGGTSIWSMTFEDGEGPTGLWAMLTIEVDNVHRRVVQARGRFNRAATSTEHAILKRWAGANGLTVCV